MPAFQIVNDTHNAFILLSSRLPTLNYRSNNESIKADPLWAVIDRKQTNLGERRSRVGNNAVNAVALSDDIRRLSGSIDSVGHAVNSQWHPQ